MPSTLMLRLLGTVVMALALYGAYWSIDSSGYNRGVAEVDGKYRAAEIERDKEQAARNKNAQEKHDADQKTIARLAADARRLRVNFPVCVASASGEGSNGAGRVLPNRVDEEFAIFQEEVGRLVERCDQLNNDTLRQNASLP